MRTDGRKQGELRPVHIATDVNCWAEGSATISMGNTRVLTTASVVDTTPSWLHQPGHGWISAEYAMLPRSGDIRMSREKGSHSGRSQEISRLVGRSLRAAVFLQHLGERQIYIDCDVLQADGGTRCASITSGFVALALALKRLKKQSIIKSIPLKNYVCAVSVGLFKEEFYLDLNSQEDKQSATDMNFVMNDKLEFIEIQGTAEKQSFTKKNLLAMMDAASKACQILIAKQKEVIGDLLF